ncbi:isocitrate dehydrogenase [Salinisphaera hydrothermalis]|uniref:Isocitrate dehydrogenase n=1 Tax=Salinisphaera hydrothermalis (strain C41B8) TaxID=1304275 RepID=A0A084IQV0_SALHC|nr:isocitrate dehydrogenase [Salinisphaera hydrothermalis]KEZ79084.1 isocitrate dehydrogenase [Salinisphaera hydrothermalis C41B8]
MASTPLTVIKGDGIGPDIVDAALKVIDALDVDFDYDYVEVGQAALDAGETDPLPQQAIDSIERTGLVLKGPVTTPVGQGYRSVNVAMRKHFDLYANVRPTLSLPGTKSRYDNLDIITVRENTGGMYSGQGQTVSEDGNRAEALSVITRSESEHILRFAFEMARARGRKKVTLAHKANIMKSTSGLFLKVGREIAEEYDDLEYEEVIVDACAMKLVMAPEKFDVIVTTNLFGDIISDLCAGLIGGLGLAPGANIGDDCAMFEAVHGSAPDIAGQNIANPTSVILATALMLDHLDLDDQAERIRQAVRGAMADGDRTTPDIGGEGSTQGFADAIIERL